jgi:hypothetical protein
MTALEDQAHVAAMTMKAANKFKDLKKKAQKRKERYAHSEKGKREEKERLMEALEAEKARQERLALIPQEVAHLMGDLSEDDEDISPEDKAIAAAARKAAVARRNWEVRRKKELQVEATLIVASKRGVHPNLIPLQYDKENEHKNLYIEATSMAQDMLTAEKEQAIVESRADIAVLRDTDAKDGLRRYYMPAAGQNEEPTREELKDARKDLARLVRERERLNSKTEQKKLQDQKDEVARMKKKKAEIEALMVGQSLGNTTMEM